MYDGIVSIRNVANGMNSWDKNPQNKSIPEIKGKNQLKLFEACTKSMGSNISQH